MAQNMEEINNVIQFMQIAQSLGQEGALAVKTGDLIDFLGDKLGVPSSVRNTPAERAFLMEQQAQMQQRDAMMLAMAGQQQAVAESQQAAAQSGMMPQ
jgi:hypothetical protein